MLSVYRTLSVRYLGRRWFRASLIVCSIALGVSTLVATRALNDTMTRAGLATVNPLAGIADLVVSNGQAPVQRQLADTISHIPGVQAANPRIFKNVKVPELDNRQILVIGLDILKELENKQKSSGLDITVDNDTIINYGKHLTLYLGGFSSAIPAVVGDELNTLLGEKTTTFKIVRDDKEFEVVRAGGLKAKGAAEVLQGSVLILDLSHATRVLGLKEDQANRIDIVLASGAKLDRIRKDVEDEVKGQGKVRTPEEQDLALGNVMSGMQTGFSLCGLAALVVGLFLVYNALAVCVAERRHEIGVLLSLGATRRQIQMLFGGEALLLGLVGSLLGLPLGIALANLGLQPAQRILSDIFINIEAKQVEISWPILLLALTAGTGTAVAAALVPAIMASHENPAEAVRRILKAPTWRSRMAQIGISVFLLGGGIVLILLRKELPGRLSLYGGLVMVLLGALVSTPLATAVLARLTQPVIRDFCSLEWRLAADNLIRSPGRTGLVIAALAAGVALVLQTAGTIKSNRQALRDWSQEFLSADLIVTPGSPLGSGDQTMDPDLRREILQHDELKNEIEAVLPTSYCNLPFGDTEIRINVIDAAGTYAIDKHRRAKSRDLPLFEKLKDQRHAVIVSENFAAKHRLDAGDILTLDSTHKGRVRFLILGKVADFSWPHGSVLMSQRDFTEAWDAMRVNWFDVYVRPGQSVADAQALLNKRFGAQHGIWVSTKEKLQTEIDEAIERLYGIAYAQQIVVVFVAALGVVTALLISVLQRRREMGLLRAIGASQVQGVRTVLAEAALMGIFGSFIGVLVGIPLLWYVLNVLILEESGYYFPMYIPWLEAALIAAFAMLAATLAGLGPAIHSVRQRIPDAIAYE